MDRKALVREYEQTPRPEGVYQVLNSQNGRTLLGVSVKAPSMVLMDSFSRFSTHCLLAMSRGTRFRMTFGCWKNSA